MARFSNSSTWAVLITGLVLLAGCEDETAPGSAQTASNRQAAVQGKTTSPTSDTKTDDDAFNQGAILNGDTENGDGETVDVADGGTALTGINGGQQDDDSNTGGGNAAQGQDVNDQIATQDVTTDANQTGDVAQDQGNAQDQTAEEEWQEIDWDAPIAQPPEAQGMSQLPGAEVWWDRENKKIVMAGRICRNFGPLEFFATLRGFQEHESIVTIKTKASYVHALLLAMGVQPGHPVQFRPEFKPAEGPEIEVTVHWTDDKGERRSARAQEWIKEFDTTKQLEHPFVFGGSLFDQLPSGGEYYTADGGFLICVANFPTAMIDLPVESSDANAQLLYEAFTERIPPEGTEVAVTLQTKREEIADASQTDAAGDSDDGQTTAGDSSGGDSTGGGN